MAAAAVVVVVVVVGKGFLVVLYVVSLCSARGNFLSVMDRAYSKNRIVAVISYDRKKKVESSVQSFREPIPRHLCKGPE